MEKAKHNSVDLVGFQQRLNESLDSLQNLGEVSSLLGFSSNGFNWLLKLDDLHEIESVPNQNNVQHVALARKWVMGIANFKGNIYTLVDFQMFLGGKATQTDMNARSLLIHPRHQIQAALIVAEVSGLVAPNGITQVSKGGAQPWVSGVYKDATGKNWNMIDAAMLSQDATMLNIAV